MFATSKPNPAIQHYRDVLSAAEYPRYGREIGLTNLPEEFTRAGIDADWNEDRDWLEKK